MWWPPPSLHFYTVLPAAGTRLAVHGFCNNIYKMEYFHLAADFCMCLMWLAVCHIMPKSLHKVNSLTACSKDNSVNLTSVFLVGCTLAQIYLVHFTQFVHIY
jgi:hypothetical protein